MTHEFLRLVLATPGIPGITFNAKSILGLLKTKNKRPIPLLGVEWIKQRPTK